MLTEENREALRLYWDELINGHNPAVAERILTPDFLLYDALSPGPVGREVFREMLTELFRSFPDIHYQAEEEFAEGARLAIRWTMSATHEGPFIGVAPTGRRVTMSGVDMLYFSAGKITALRVEANLLDLVHQLGAVPTLDLSC